MALRKFRRSKTDRKLIGLFGGLGDSFGIDPTYLRLGFTLLALVTGVVPCVIAYLIGWAITLEETTEGPGSDDPAMKRDDAQG
ncbi:MAG: phage shock protein PspC [Fibrobacteres bacterium]|nr:phage shock protein PspC [Fibrobacterota bacterium]